MDVPSAVGLDTANGMLHAPSWRSQAAATADARADVVGAKRPDRAGGAQLVTKRPTPPLGGNQRRTPPSLPVGEQKEEEGEASPMAIPQCLQTIPPSYQRSSVDRSPTSTSRRSRRKNCTAGCCGTGAVGLPIPDRFVQYK